MICVHLGGFPVKWMQLETAKGTTWVLLRLFLAHGDKGKSAGSIGDTGTRSFC